MTDSDTHWECPAKAPNGEPYVSVRSNGGFYYLRRTGVDSIAFILKNGPQVGLLRCRHGATGIEDNRAFTGSLDMGRDKAVFDVVRTEVLEEAGYEVGFERILVVGLFEVGHMTDEQVHLFVVDVSGLQPKPVKWTGLEARDLIGTVWTSDTRDWKALLLINHLRKLFANA